MVQDKSRSVVGTSAGLADPYAEDAAVRSVDDATPDLPDFAEVYEAMPAAAFLIDADSGRVLHGNLAAQRLSGHNRTQLAGRKAGRLFPRSELGRFWETAAFGDGRPTEFIGWIQTRNGCEVPISALARRLDDPRLCVLLAFDITELKLSLDGLSERARHDPLTGLINREQLEFELAECLKRRPAAKTLAMIQIDVDELRRVNDAYGYAKGDQVLLTLSRRLQSVLADAVLLARRGSDTFVAVLSDLPPALLEARKLLAVRAEAVLAAAREPFLLDGATAVLSCSIGIALAPHDSEDGDSLQRCADLALQQSRRQRRDGYRYFIESDLRRLDDEIRVESLLRDVIRAESAEQVWLPIFRLQDETCIGIESLLRGGQALRGYDTGRIVAVAESRGLLPELGHQNLRSSLRAWAQLSAAGRDPAIHHLSLNLTVQELLASGFVDEIVRAAETARLPLARLMIEISERDLFASLERVRQPMERLGQLGVQFAIDGFGSGFSSLALLRDLPVAVIKIDRSFVWQLEASQRDRDIVKAMIQLAHSMNVRAAAVGVETRPQLQALRGMGCDLAQGYLLSRPLSLEELSRFLRPHAARQR